MVLIPINNSEEVIDLSSNELPSLEEIISILQAERSTLGVWFDVAIEYYKSGRYEEYAALLLNSRDAANIVYRNSNYDKMRMLDSLAAYYVRMGRLETSVERKKELFGQAAIFYCTADRIVMYDSNHLTGRAFLCLNEGDKMEQADSQFNFVLSNVSVQIPVPALLGKACICYSKKDYKLALTYYKRVLMMNPQGPAAIRVGLGLCLLKIGFKDEAMLAFVRALELDPKHVQGLICMAIHCMNIRGKATLRRGVHLLSKAYTLDSTNPMILNHLADHFFYKKDIVKVKQLALHALHNTEQEAIRAESCYQLARALHVEEEHGQAFQYYYQSTQYAPHFVLPHYGLGQMYIQRGDYDNAAICFEKVLKIDPENYDSMKILGSLYSCSTNQTKREIAKEYLKKVTSKEPGDIDSWIELAQLCEQNDVNDSLKNYTTAIDLCSTQNRPVPTEVLNNIGSVHYRLGNYKEAVEYFEESLKRSKFELQLIDETGKDESESRCVSALIVTTSYNLARVNEASCNYGEAEKIYKNILKQHPNYMDCYLRLGCMARDRGQIYEASDWFKEALQLDTDNPDAWILLANLHLSKCEWQPAQKKFERITTNPSLPFDSYCNVALANIWLHSSVQTQTLGRDTEKEARHHERALGMFRMILKTDPGNIWAANGVGAVLAYKGYFIEARDLFAQVREVIADFPDIWINLAHIYVELKKFVGAVYMYEACAKKFYKHHHIDILQYSARANYRDGKFEEAKMALLKARRVAPTDTILLYNLALILQKLANQILQDPKSNLRMVLSAVHDLTLAHKYFQYLSTKVDRTKNDLRYASNEARQCQDLLSQAQYHVSRARQVDAEEKALRRNQEAEIEAFRRKQAEELKEQEEMKRRQLEETNRKREEFKEQKKHAVIFVEETTEENASKKHGRKHEADTSDGAFSPPGEGEEEETYEPKRRRNRPRRASTVEGAGRIGRPNKEKSSGRKRAKKIKMEEEEDDDEQTFRPRRKIISRATISSSEDSQSDNESGNPSQNS